MEDQNRIFYSLFHKATISNKQEINYKIIARCIGHNQSWPNYFLNKEAYVGNVMYIQDLVYISSGIALPYNPSGSHYGNNPAIYCFLLV